MARKLKRVVKKDFGSFVERFDLLPPPQPAPPKAPHTLTGLTFAVADENSGQPPFSALENHWTYLGRPTEKVPGLRRSILLCPGPTTISFSPHLSKLGESTLTIYGSSTNISTIECPIFLVEFIKGEKVRLLSTCNHGFHVCCIDVWLSSHSSYSAGRHSLLDRFVAAVCIYVGNDRPR